ncbi:hypothetical protein [Allonocardiopsis opalescens]|uniref:Uncharacterized protein n=1 Tax=Allonocardiopsis opalescens TaxID=1144618 RepID=A0A2T0QEA0_9ACTN|nr:hypothetical protein [Allonocardiopsis opalescens]PRY02222.1 hypothetical protein CLV72_101823 [Allonocardiopsis opalescens]
MRAGAAAPRWRYLVIAIGFAVLAGTRWLDGDPLWAAVFALAVPANIWLAVVEGRRAAEEAPLPAADPPPGVLAEALDGHRRRLRQWRTVAAGCAAAGLLLLFAAPAAGGLAGAVALYAAYRAHRSRRAVHVLSRAGAR